MGVIGKREGSRMRVGHACVEIDRGEVGNGCARTIHICCTAETRTTVSMMKLGLLVVGGIPKTEVTYNFPMIEVGSSPRRGVGGAAVETPSADAVAQLRSGIIRELDGNTHLSRDRIAARLVLAHVRAWHTMRHGRRALVVHGTGRWAVTCEMDVSLRLYTKCTRRTAYLGEVVRHSDRHRGHEGTEDQRANRR